MPDIKLDGISPLRPNVARIGEGLSHAGIIAVAASFKENMIRVVRLNDFLPSVAGWTAKFKDYDASIDQEVFGTTQPTLWHRADKNAYERSVQMRRKRFADEFSDFQKNRDVTPETIINTGIDIINNLLAVAPPLTNGLEVIFAAAITGTWTAFEALAGDLWVAALNHHPKTLAGLNGTDNGWQNASSFDEEQKTDGDMANRAFKKGNKVIELGVLQSKMGNLTESFGTLLKIRYSFQTLPVIRKAYAHAFSKDFNTIRDALNHSSLDHLSGIRNALVHCAGNADAKFKRQTNGCRHFSNVNVGDTIQLTAEIADDVTACGTVQAIKLIEAVDQWIKNHSAE